MEIKKYVHVMGTRPHIVKFCPIESNDIVIWTGQHYDDNMYKDLWEEFNLPKIKHILPTTSPLEMTENVRKVLKDIKTKCVIVYGDTYSTLAGASAAKELEYKLAHIEAGIRSKYARIENEIRIDVDRMSDYLFCPTDKALQNLSQENILGKAWMVGDVCYDEYLKHREHNGITLATFHRAEHVDTKEGLNKIFSMLHEATVFPCHPRTLKMIKEHNIKVPSNVTIMKPFSYSQMQKWIKTAKVVITDSGGVTKEAYFAGCRVIPYEIDEWQEIFSFGKGDAKLRIAKILKEELN